MAIKDLALFKLAGSALKKVKDKVAGVSEKKPNNSDVTKTGESVQETFKAMLGKTKDTEVSEVTVSEKAKTVTKKNNDDIQEKVSSKALDTKSTPKVEKEETTLKTPATKEKMAKKATKPVAKSTTQKVVEKETVSKEHTKAKSVAKKTTQTTKEKATSKAKKPIDKKVESKKAKSTAKETTSTTKEKVTKKATTASSSTKPTKREAKINLYTKDIKKHYGSVDESFLAIIVKNLGPSIYRKDAELVSCSDPKELETVRKNFLIKKLGFDKSENEMLDGEIAKVCETLKGVRTKYRATFHYILAKNLKKESALS